MADVVASKLGVQLLSYLSLSMCLDGKTLGYWERERKGKERKKEKKNCI